jgi:N-acetylglucosamine malate deacetylase 1
MEMKIGKVDVLALGVHPDDIELGAGGTLLKLRASGKRIGLCDLTMGELGTRGSGKLRFVESENARKLLDADFRVNLKMADGFFELSRENKVKIVEIIRACKPDVVLCNAISDRHPDHGRGAELQKVACFLSGLRRIETNFEGIDQTGWRPKMVLHYIQDYYVKPDIIVDVTDFWEKRMESILAYSSQFYNPRNNEPETAISSKEFLDNQAGRGLQMGRYINAKYGEGFVSERPIGIELITDLL